MRLWTSRDRDPAANRIDPVGGPLVSPGDVMCDHAHPPLLSTTDRPPFFVRAALDAGVELRLRVDHFVASAGSGFLGARLGTGALLAAGCGLAAAGLLGLSVATAWWMVPVVTLLLGGGSGLIDAAANAHTSLNRGVRYMGWLHASWAMGAALGPLLVVTSIGVTGSWRGSLVVMAAAFLAVGLLVGSRRQDWIDTGPDMDRPSPAALVQPSSRRRALVLLIGLFVPGAWLGGTPGHLCFTQLSR